MKKMSAALLLLLALGIFLPQTTAWAEPSELTVTLSSTGTPASAKVGDIFTVTATVAGGGGSYEYEYLLYNCATGSTNTLKARSASNKVSYQLGSAVDRIIRVKVYDMDGHTGTGELSVKCEKPLGLRLSSTGTPGSAKVNDIFNVTATATGGSGGYEYEYLLYNCATGRTNTLKARSASNKVSYQLGSAVDRIIKVNIWDKDGHTVSGELPITCAKPLALNLTVAGNPDGANVGDVFTVTASGTGGSGSYEYEFLLYNCVTGSTNTLKARSTSDRVMYQLGSAVDRIIKVNVYDNDGHQASGEIPIRCAKGITVTLSSTGNPSAARVGDVMHVTASATGGSGSYLYEFLLYNRATGNTNTLKARSSSNQVSYQLGSAVDRIIKVNVYDSSARLGTAELPVTLVKQMELSLASTGTPDSASVGDIFHVTAAASGGSGSYQYEFLLYNCATGSTNTLQARGSSNKVSYRLGSEVNRIIKVNAYDSYGAIVTRELGLNSGKDLSLNLTCTGNPLNARAGDLFTITAAASGGKGSYEYEFLLYNCATGSTNVLRARDRSGKVFYRLGSAADRNVVVTAYDSEGHSVSKLLYLVIGESGKYTITTDSTPLNGAYTSAASYTDETKTYYTFRSYLDRLEKDGGGKLVVKPGVYEICSSLWIPSHTELVLEKGAVLKLSRNVGSSGLTPSTTLLVACNAADISKTFTGYDGAADVTIRGEGVIDLDTVTNGVGLQCRQNDHVTVDGITFRGGENSHMLVMHSSRNVVVRNCVFTGGSSMSGIGINTQYNNIPCRDVTISGCTFEGLQQGVGTGRSTADVYTQNVRIQKSIFDGCVRQAVYAVGLKDCQITENTFQDMPNASQTVYLVGTNQAVLRGNLFARLDRPVTLTADSTWTSVTMSDENKAVLLADNSYDEIVSVFVAYCDVYNTGVRRLNVTWTNQSANPSYIVGPDTATFRDIYASHKDYNNATKTYFMLRSYLEHLESVGGGTLILQSGTYNIPCVLHIPSHVSVILKDGVVINKTADVGSSSLTPSGILFDTVTTASANVSNSVGGYGGVSDVTVKAEGANQINLNHGSMLFFLGHSKNITLDGLYCTINVATGQGVMVRGSNNVSVKGSTFRNMGTGVSIDSTSSNLAQNVSWCRMDNTLCATVSLTDCVFENLQRGVMTSNFDSDKYQSGVAITGCRFENIASDAVSMLNWAAPRVENCVFRHIGADFDDNGMSVCAIRMNGVSNPTVKGNRFIQCEMTVGIGRIDDEVRGISTVNTIADDTCKDMVITNTAENVNLYYIARLDDTLYKFFYYPDSKNSFEITPDSVPYHNMYYGYAESERQYFAIKTALEQLERVGGGTVYLRAGTYYLPMSLYIPSNVTLCLDDGVTIRCAVSDISLFILCNSLDILDGVKYSGYGGVHDVAVKGPATGTAVIDMQGSLGTAFMMAHTSDVEIANLTFVNMNPNTHFIELDASYNCRIHDNVFRDTTALNTFKEAINLDIPDLATGGFSSEYTSYDKTADSHISIYNNEFRNLPAGIGSHMYTEGSPHTDIKINNNRFVNCEQYAIHMMNWSNVEVNGNSISITKDDNRLIAFMMDGVINPTIKNNTITNAFRLAQIQPAWYDTSYSTELQAYAPAYNVISEANKADLLNGNTLNDVHSEYIYYSNVCGGEYEKWYDPHPELNDITVTPTAAPYRDRYTTLSSYTPETAVYYMLQSYLDHLKEIGGGKLTLDAGTYTVCGALFVPSNVELVLKDGATLRLSLDVGSSGLPRPTTLICLAEVDQDPDGLAAYGGVSHVKVSGGTLDLDSIDAAMAIQCRQNDDVTIDGVTVTGGSNGIGIRIASSRNVTIKNVNISGGTDMVGVRMSRQYNHVPCQNVTVSSSRISNVRHALDTDSDREGGYQTGVRIIDNVIHSSSEQAVYAYGLRTPVIQGNTFKNVNSDYRAVAIYGVIEPTVKNNVFENTGRPFYFGVTEDWNMNIISDVAQAPLLTENDYSAITDPVIEYFEDYGDSAVILDPRGPDPDDDLDTFSLSPDSMPLNNKYVDFTSYTPETAHYYMLQSYLDRIQEKEGGKLTLTAGTYTVCSTLVLPANLDLELKKDAVIVLSQNVGASGRTPVSTLFRITDANVILHGDGEIDLGSVTYAVAVQCRQNDNATVDGITVTGGANGAGIQIVSAHDITVRNAMFNGGTGMVGVRLTPQIDNTPCRDVTIDACRFSGLVQGISTSSDVTDVYHRNIELTNNTFDTCSRQFIYASGFDTPVIQGNTFREADSSVRAVTLYGVKEPTFKDNFFENVPRPMLLGVNEQWRSNTISTAAREQLLSNNSYRNVDNLQVEYYAAYGDSVTNWRPTWTNLGEDESVFTVSPDSAPYKNRYVGTDSYTPETAHYYMLQSYLDRIQENEGGKLVLTEGTYTVCSTLVLPANMELELQEGAVVVLSQDVGASGRSPVSTLFRIGSTGAAVSGKGTVDLGDISYAVAFQCRESDGVTIDGLTFRGGQSSGIIALNSARNVVIRGCTFEGSSNMNGIRLNTQYNSVPCQNITVQGCTFTDFGQAIDTPGVVDNIYQQNITVKGNTFRHCISQAVRGTGWKDCTIADNVFEDMESGKRAIFLYEVVNPSISGNTFRQLDKPIFLHVKDGWSGNSISDGLKTKLLNDNSYEDMNFLYVEFYESYGSSYETWSVNWTALS